MTVHEIRAYLTDHLGDAVPLRSVANTVNWVVEHVRNRGTWSFWEKDAQLTFVDEYDTGTVEVTNGTALVTGTGVTWVAGMAGRQIRIDGGPEHNISSLAADTFTLENNYVGTDTSGLSYVVYQARFPLATDVDQVLAVWDATNQRELTVEDARSQRRRAIYRIGTSSYLSRSIAVFGRDSNNAMYLYIDPPPAAAADARYWYYKTPATVSGPGDSPDTPTDMHLTIAQGCLARQMQQLRVPEWREEWAHFKNMVEDRWMKDEPLQFSARLARADGEDQVQAVIRARYERLIAVS